MWKQPLLQLLLTVSHVLSLKPVLHVFLGIEMMSAERSKVILACSNVLVQRSLGVFLAFCFHRASNDPLVPQLGNLLELNRVYMKV